MRQPLYLRQLKKDLEVWIEKGWVDHDNREAILANAGTNAEPRSLVPIMMLVGAVLIGFAFLTFVAANWAGMDKLPRLALLLGSLWTAFGLAIWSQHRSPFAFEGFLLLGLMLFGVNIMFIAQTYNINADYPGGVMLWAFGATIAALLVPSRAALALAFVLAGLWTGIESTAYKPDLHLEFLVLWAVLAGITASLAWRPGQHLAALSLLVWLVFALAYFVDTLDLAAIDGLLPYTLASAISATAGLVILSDRERNPILFVYGYFMTLVLMFALLTVEDASLSEGSRSISAIVAIALAGLAALGALIGKLRKLDGAVLALLALALVLLPYFQNEKSVAIFWAKNAGHLAFLIWALSFGAWRHSRLIINLALVSVGGQVLYVYFSTFEGFLSDTTFFAISGVIFILSAFGLDRVRRNLMVPAAGDAQ